MTTIACVLKSGGDFTLKYVYALQRQLGRRIVCLTDVNATSDDRVLFVALENNLPGWWSKLELFKLRGSPVLYFDLDTLIVGDIDDLVQFDPQDELYMIQDLSYRKLRPNSGVMMFRPCDRLQTSLLDQYNNKERVRYTDEAKGDGDFIADRYGNDISFLQDEFPGWIKSYKFSDCKEKGAGDARIICFHGKPRPHMAQCALGDYWRQHASAS